MEQALYYHQITSIPRKCVIKSRSECDTSITFCGRKFKNPILPSNMVCTVNEDICKWLSFNEYFYIYHRFSDIRKFIQRTRAESWPLVSISVGVKEEDKLLICDISESKCRVDFVTIDIANGFSDSVAEMIQHIKNNLPNVKVIAGNIWGDKDSIEFLQSVGADAVKVGLSCGKACFLGDTIVLTNEGKKKIKDVKIGDYVKTHTGNFSIVEDHIKKSSSDLIEINGVVCTLDHEFYVIDNIDNRIDDEFVEKNAYWIKAKDLDSKKHRIITTVH